MLNLNGHTKDYIIYNYEQKKYFEMRKIQDIMDKIHLIFWSLPISPWVCFATWLHLEFPPKNIEKINKYQLSNIELVTVSEMGMFGIAGKLLVPSITFYQKIQKTQNLLLMDCPKPNQP